MGYYTSYNLGVHKKGPPREKKDTDFDDPFGEEVVGGNNPIADLRGFSDEAKYAIDDRGWCNDQTKWYDHDDDMKKLSKMYPGWIFKLHGEGEETGDLWNKYFKDGKEQYCEGKVVYPPYDESELV